jgi:hypothetical protein
MRPTFVEDITGYLLARSWVGRFVNDHSDSIDPRYLNPLNKSRKEADYVRQYRAYYDLLAQKIKQYNIKPHDIYNMNEKDFLIGMLQKTRR